jgi:hypothetical protein
MRWLCAIFLLSICGIAAEPNRNVTAEYRDDGGRKVVYICNHSGQAVTAFKITQSFQGMRNARMANPQSAFDMILEAGLSPIPANQCMATGIGGPATQAIGVKLDAAIFADGESFGEPFWITNVVEQRRKMYQDIPVVISHLKEGLAAKEDIPKLIERIRKYQQFVSEQENNYATGSQWASAVSSTTISFLSSFQQPQSQTTPAEACDMIINQLNRWFALLEKSKPAL